MDDIAAVAGLTRASVQRRFSKAELRVHSEVPIPQDTLGSVLEELDQLEKIRTNSLGVARAMHAKSMAYEWAERHEAARQGYGEALEFVEYAIKHEDEPLAGHQLRELAARIRLDRALLRRSGAKWWSLYEQAEADDLMDLAAVRLYAEESDDDLLLTHLDLRAGMMPRVPLEELPIELHLLATRIKLGPFPDLTVGGDVAWLAASLVEEVESELMAVAERGLRSDRPGSDPFRAAQALARVAMVETLCRPPSRDTADRALEYVLKSASVAPRLGSLDPAAAHDTVAPNLLTEDLTAPVVRLMQRLAAHPSDALDELADQLVDRGTAWVGATVSLGRAAQFEAAEQWGAAYRAAESTVANFDQLCDEINIRLDGDDREVVEEAKRLMGRVRAASGEHPRADLHVLLGQIANLNIELDRITDLPAGLAEQFRTALEEAALTVRRIADGPDRLAY